MREVQSFVCGVSDAERKHCYIVLVARHWIRLTEIADIRLYERSSIYRLHRRNLICNREFLIQPLTAKSILQLDWVINYYRLYNAVSLFPFLFFFLLLLTFSTSSSYPRLLVLKQDTSFYFAFFQLDNENKTKRRRIYIFLLTRSELFFFSFVELLQTSRVSFHFFFFSFILLGPRE